jgi:hypothetical protein
MRAGLILVVCGLLGLTGCAGGVISANLAEVSQTQGVAGAKLTGVVHGGQQPIVGAEIFLFAANTTGYGGNGLAAGASNASISLLQSAANTTQDTISTDPAYLDYYTTTDSNGNFAITGDYSCTPGAQVYIYALGGNPTYPTGSANSAIGLLAALGPCPSTDSFPSTTYVVVNEVSTIATAYAFAGFATDAVHVSSSGTPLAQTGIANAFANVANLEKLSTGAALATTPPVNGVSSGTVPQATINTLANILAACVNTNSPSSSGCSTLFSNAMSAGSTGTAATDTATAAINIAHNPGSNIAALYDISTAAPPFAPTLSVPTNDFTIGLVFTGGGLNGPKSIAIDGSGNAWVANFYLGSVSASVSEFSSAGNALSPSAGFTEGGLSLSDSIAIDGSGNAWIADGYDDDGYPFAVTGMSELSNAGVALSPSTGGYLNIGGYFGGGLNGPSSVAIDGNGNAWFVNSSFLVGVVSKFSGSLALSPATGYTGGGLSGTDAIAIDGSGNAWIANGPTYSLSKLSSAGAALSPPTSGYTGGGLIYPSSVAIDGTGNVWAANGGNDSASKFSGAGVALSPSTGYTGGGLKDPVSIAIDGAGNAWFANLASVSELSSAGIAISPSLGYFSTSFGYTGGVFSQPSSIAVDGSGDAWVANYYNSTVSELIGIATPVITPIYAGLPATPTADGSSNLGTRP